MGYKTLSSLVHLLRNKVHHVSLPSHCSHPLFLFISARYVHETLAFQKHAVQQGKKKMSTLKETQIINGWYTSAPQRPTNGLKKKIQFFFQREHKKYSKCNGSKFPKTSISVPATPKRRTPPRRSIARSPSRDSRHGEATAINSVNARREAKMSSGPSLHGEQGEP